MALELAWICIRCTYTCSWGSLEITNSKAAAEGMAGLCDSAWYFSVSHLLPYKVHKSKMNWRLSRKTNSWSKKAQIQVILLLGHSIEVSVSEFKETWFSIKIFCNRHLIWFFIFLPPSLLASGARRTFILNSYTEDVQGEENELYQMSIIGKFVGDILYIYSNVYVCSQGHP